VPSEDGVGGHDRREPLDQLPAKPLPLCREPAALLVVETKPPLAVQLVEDSTQADPQLLTISPKGRGDAVVVIDAGRLGRGSDSWGRRGEEDDTHLGAHHLKTLDTSKLE